MGGREFIWIHYVGKFVVFEFDKLRDIASRNENNVLCIFGVG